LRPRQLPEGFDAAPSALIPYIDNDDDDDDEVGDPVGPSLRPSNGPYYQPKRSYWGDANADVDMTSPPPSVPSDIDMASEIDPDVAIHLYNAYCDTASAWLERRKGELLREYGRDVPMEKMREAIDEHLAYKQLGTRKYGWAIPVGYKALDEAAAAAKRREREEHGVEKRKRLAAENELWVVRRERGHAVQTAARWRTLFWVVWVLFVVLVLVLLLSWGARTELQWRVEACEDKEKWEWMD
jgi:hypothetical protein